MKRNVTLSLKRTLLSSATAVAMLMGSQSAMAQYVKLTALSGTGGTGGEGYPSLVDANPNTKMGHSFDSQNPDRKDAYIIFKAEKAIVPEMYFLVTGNDTGGDPARNWENWTISAANFASDEEATRESEAWVLVDEREGEALPQENFGVWETSFSVETTTAYQYYKIEITECAGHKDVWLQMSEFGFGYYGDFEAWKYAEDNRETTKEEKVKYTLLEGTKNDGSGEALDKLFDGTSSTKWGNGFTNREKGSTENGAYFIFKTSRPMAPTSYCLTTANDTKSYSGRNWKQWQVYAMNASSASEVTRNSDKWVVIDERDNVGQDQLPAENFTNAYFAMEKANGVEYTYFKVELDQIVNNGDYMQMAEFALGDQYTLVFDRDDALQNASALDLNVVAPQDVLDAYAEILKKMESCDNIMTLAQLIKDAAVAAENVHAGENAYIDLNIAYNNAESKLAENALSAAAAAYVTGLVGENAIAPNNEYPAGNRAYVLANRNLDTEGAKAEAARINDYIIANLAVIDDPIEVTYEALDGTGGFGGEEHGMLIDGDRENTKWCTNTFPSWMIFKASEPIKPSYYGLVTGGDTYSYPNRNWTNWKIWAGNFASDEEANDRNAAGWVLIDNKVNVGTDVLKTYNKYESYIYLSEVVKEKYQYFKIEVEDPGSGLVQMNEFTFYNQGNFKAAQEEYVAKLSDFDYESNVAYKGLIDSYKEKYTKMQTTSDAPTLMSLYNECVDLQGQIEASQELYVAYQEAYAEFDANAFNEFEKAFEWACGYAEENIAPNSIYTRGTYAWIMEGNLNNDDLKAETTYITNMLEASFNPEKIFILLGGHTVGEWGDGFYGNLIDAYAKNYIDEESGEEVKATKWGGSPDENGNTYIIFRTLGEVNPFFYTLTTGNDTGSYQDRNWGTWYIYGANFDGDGEATKDAEGWVLIDAKENIGKDRLHPESSTDSYFGFSTETTTPYMYYKVVVTKAFAGNAIQMNDMRFGTEEEFAELKKQYTADALDFETDIVADQALIDEYLNHVDEIGDCENMEALFRVNYTLETQREAIMKSAAQYDKYQAALNTVAEYLKTTPLDASDALDALNTYMNEEAEASETYPNGTSKYIIATHELNDEAVLAEIEFLTTLQAAAVAKGYGAGADLTSMVANPKFAKGAEGWNGEVFGYNSFEEKNMSAAEFKDAQAKFDINQTLTGLKNGLYEIQINGAIRPADDINSLNHTAMIYANGNAAFLKTDRQDMIPVEEVEDGVNWDVNGSKAITVADGEEETTIGYVLWGLKSCAYAFAAGRYENSIVAEVTDGTLTFGVKNEGTVPANDWTGLGNVRVSYLGADASTDAAKAALDRAAANQEAIVAAMEAYNDEQATVEDENYNAMPFANKAAIEAIKANLAGDKLAAVKANTDLYYTIYNCKGAYVDAVDATQKVQTKYENHLSLMSSEEQSALMDAIYAVMDGAMGVYTLAEVAAAKADLYAKYPAYFELDNTKKGNLTFEEVAPFSYEVTVSGKNPYMGIVKGLYEALNKDEKILCFEYKVDATVENGTLYYATPNFTSDSKTAYGSIEASAEWKTAYINLAEGLHNYNFGANTDHWLRWQLTTQGTFNMSIRNITIVTEEQMKANGGSTINGINGIAADSAVKSGIYTLTGVRVQKPVKGLYIMDGRKVLVK